MTMEPFVRATYELEGEVLYAYQILSCLYAHITLAHHQNVLAVAKDLAQGNAACETQLINYANMLHPGLQLV